MRFLSSLLRQAASLLILGFCFALPGPALGGAEILAYEGFEYLEGGVVAGAATGEGWKNAWGESGDVGDDRSELIVGGASLSVPPGRNARTGRRADLNHGTGRRVLTRDLQTAVGVADGASEYTFAFTLDLGGGFGVDYAGIELSSSTSAERLFIGKPAGAGPANRGMIGLEIPGEPFASTGVAGAFQRYLELTWTQNPAGPSTVRLAVFNSATGFFMGSVTRSVPMHFDRVALLARRDMAHGTATVSFDEILLTRTSGLSLHVGSENPEAGIQIELSPGDAGGRASGTTPFSRSFRFGSQVTLEAPGTAEGGAFDRWLVNGEVLSHSPVLEITLEADTTLVAVYASAASPYDAWATTHFGDPALPAAQPGADPDGDGRTNWEEFLAGSDPKDPGSFFRLSLSPAETGLRLTWPGLSGRTYAIEGTGQLAPAQWSEVMAPVAGIDGEMQFITSPPVGSERMFYRVRIALP